LWSGEVTKERFEELAAAYGADLTRWPAEVREEAALLAAAEPGFAQNVLGREEALDAALDALPLRPASSALFERVVESAPPLRRRRLRWRGWLAPAGLGAGLAAATAAGVLLGAQLSQHASSNVAQTADATTARAIAEVDVSGLSGDV
jgi:hypothetical protein